MRTYLTARAKVVGQLPELLDEFLAGTSRTTRVAVNWVIKGGTWAEERLTPWERADVAKGHGTALSKRRVESSNVTRYKSTAQRL